MSSQPEDVSTSPATKMATDTDTKTNTLPTVINDNTNNSPPFSENEIEETIAFQQWHPLITHLQHTIRRAFPASPKPTSTPKTNLEHGEISTFSAYWRGVFIEFLKEIETDDSIPKYLTTPPLKRFHIVFFTEDSGLDCPCCLPDVQASIIIENEKGVTKGDFVRGVGAYLYGLDLSPSLEEGELGAKFKFDGGEFKEGRKEENGEVEITLPRSYSEYVIETKEVYKPWLVKVGDRERTLEEEENDVERPLGGWPAGDLGSSTEQEPVERDEGGCVAGVDEGENSTAGEGQNVGEVAESQTMPEKQSELAGSKSAAEGMQEMERVEAAVSEISLGGEEQEKEQSEQAVKQPEEATGLPADARIQEPDTSQDKEKDDSDTEEDDDNSTKFCDEATEYRYPAVVYGSNWLTGGGGRRGPNGEREVYSHMGYDDEPFPRVWLFCCPPGDFEDRISSERFQQKEKNGKRFFASGTNVGKDGEREKDKGDEA